MTKKKSTSSEVAENIEVSIGKISLKAERINGKDFRTFLLFIGIVVGLIFVAGFFVAIYLAPHLGNIPVLKALQIIGKGCFRDSRFKQ